MNKTVAYTLLIGLGFVGAHRLYCKQPAWTYPALLAVLVVALILNSTLLAAGAAIALNGIWFYDLATMHNWFKGVTK